MPPLDTLSGVGVSGSTSRKRPYQQITRSETRSISPQPPAKRRRRIGRSPSMSSNSTASRPASPVYDSSSEIEPSPRSPNYIPTSPDGPQSPTYSPTSPQYDPQTPTPSPERPVGRFIGDGFDYRVPVMTAPNLAHHTIDLTADDDASLPPSPLLRISVDPSTSPLPQQQEARAPPFGSREVEIIDVSDSEEDDIPLYPRPLEHQTARHLPVRISSSPDVQFVSERPAQADPGDRPASRQSAAVQAPNHPPGDRSSLGEMLRRGTQFMFQNFNNAALNFVPNRPTAVQAINANTGLAAGPQDNFADLRFDYQQQGFAMGTRESETPQVTSEPYKPPPKAKSGFTRDVEEDEVLVCPQCNEELASGEGEVKQQVWIIKQCGHVYCGECATKRPLKGNKRDARNARNREKTNSFRACSIAGCEKPVSSKGSMFQIYL